MTLLDPDRAAFNAMWAELAENHQGRWVIIHQGRLVGFYSGREDASEMAAIRFGRGPYLISQICPPGSSAFPANFSGPTGDVELSRSA